MTTAELKAEIDLQLKNRNEAFEKYCTANGAIQALEYVLVKQESAETELGDIIDFPQPKEAVR